MKAGEEQRPILRREFALRLFSCWCWILLNGALAEEYLPWSNVQVKSLLPVQPEARALFPNAMFPRNQD